MWIPDFLITLFGKSIKNDLQLEDTNMADDSTPWYKNLSTLGHIFGILVGLGTSTSSLLVNDFHVVLPVWLVKAGGVILTLAAGMGIYNNHSA